MEIAGKPVEVGQRNDALSTRSHQMHLGLEDRKGHDLRYSVDIGKIQAELGYEPLVPFDQGLQNLISWASTI